MKSACTRAAASSDTPNCDSKSSPSPNPAIAPQIEYRRHSNLDAANPAHVLELIEWRDALISSVRVFHFDA